MVLLKIIGCLSIFTASTFIGYVLAKDFEKRPKQLRELQILFLALENEIAFLSNILKDGFFNICESNPFDTAVLFKEAAQKLELKGMTISNAWNAAVEKLGSCSSLTKEDKNILFSFGTILGNSDTEGQIRNIQNVIEKLKLQEQKAEESKKKNGKLYGNLGVLGGLAIIIILL